MLVLVHVSGVEQQEDAHSILRARNRRLKACVEIPGRIRRFEGAVAESLLRVVRPAHQRMFPADPHVEEATVVVRCRRASYRPSGKVGGKDDRGDREDGGLHTSKAITACMNLG